MKNSLKNLLSGSWLSLALLAIFSLGVLSCKKEEVVLPPVISVSVSTLSGAPGAQLTATVSAEATGGLSLIRIRKNGLVDASTPDVVFDGIVTSGKYEFKYTIPATSREGDNVAFIFTSVDKGGLTSSDASVVITTAAIPNKPIVEVTGVITANTTWTADKIYKLKGFVRVGNDPTVTDVPAKNSGPTLTIQPGTVIFGEKATKGTLIIQRGAKIIAEGTATSPIVFTSESAVGSKEPGDWGGLVICGRASNNQPGGVFELEGGYKAFSGGGTSPDNADNSGSLKYVRIEYAGVPVNPNQEVNSLTLGAVGSETKIEYVMCTYGLDDSFEWFGGTVNAKYLIAYKGLDDDFDVDFGFSGFVQFGLGVRGATLADQSGSNGFEVDNNGQGSDAVPFT